MYIKNTVDSKIKTQIKCLWQKSDQVPSMKLFLLMQPWWADLVYEMLCFMHFIERIELQV